MTTDPDCFACLNTAAADLPDRERIVRTEHWRVAHAFDSSLPGWLVLLPTRHVTSYAELSEDAAAEFGLLILDLSRALARVVGCAKTYQMQFSEQEGFAHLHVHLVPRSADLAPDLRGPRVFAHLGAGPERRVPPGRMDEVARQIREFVPRR